MKHLVLSLLFLGASLSSFAGGGTVKSCGDTYIVKGDLTLNTSTNAGGDACCIEGVTIVDGVLTIIENGVAFPANLPTDSLVVTTNENGTVKVTHTAVDGKVTVFDSCPVCASLEPIVVGGVTNGFTFVGLAGSTDILFPQPDISTLTYLTDADGNTTSIVHNAGGVETIVPIQPACCGTPEFYLDDGTNLVFEYEEGNGVTYSNSVVIAGGTIDTVALNADGSATTSTVAVATACVPETFLGRYIGHHGDSHVPAGKYYDLTLQRALGVGGTGTAGIPHVLSPHQGDLQVNALDSDDGNTQEVTTKHPSGILNCVRCEAQGSVTAGGCTAIASVDSKVLGVGQNIATASRTSEIQRGFRIAVDGSLGMLIDGGGNTNPSRIHVGGSQYIGVNGSLQIAGIEGCSGSAGASTITGNNVLAGLTQTAFFGGQNQFEVSGQNLNCGMVHGVDNTLSGAVNVGGIYSSRRCELFEVDDAAVIASRESNINDNNALGGSCTTLLNSQRTEANDPNATVWGFAFGGTLPSTANRTGRFSTPTGNMDISGAFTGGVVFPGVSEMWKNLDGVPHKPGTPLKVLITTEEFGVTADFEGDADTVARAPSACAVLLGNTKFSGVPRFERGAFGELVTEEVEVEKILVRKVEGEDGQPDSLEEYTKTVFEDLPKETAEFIALRDAGGPFVPRSKRPTEWTAIEVIGQAHMRVPADTKAGDLVHGLRVLKITSKGVGLVYVNLDLGNVCDDQEFAFGIKKPARHIHSSINSSCTSDRTIVIGCEGLAETSSDTIYIGRPDGLISEYEYNSQFHLELKNLVAK